MHRLGRPSHMVLWNIAIQAMEAAREEANAARDELRSMTMTLKVRPKYFDHPSALLSPRRFLELWVFDRSDNCCVLYNRASNEQYVARNRRLPKLQRSIAGDSNCPCGLSLP